MSKGLDSVVVLDPYAESIRRPEQVVDSAIAPDAIYDPARRAEPSFSEAFAAARAAGLKGFSWNGKTYTTQTREEVAPPPAPPLVRPPEMVQGRSPDRLGLPDTPAPLRGLMGLPSVADAMSEARARVPVPSIQDSGSFRASSEQAAKRDRAGLQAGYDAQKAMDAEVGVSPKRYVKSRPLPKIDAQATPEQVATWIERRAEQWQEENKNVTPEQAVRLARKDFMEQYPRSWTQAAQDAADSLLKMNVDVVAGTSKLASMDPLVAAKSLAAGTLNALDWYSEDGRAGERLIPITPKELVSSVSDAQTKPVRKFFADISKDMAGFSEYLTTRASPGTHLSRAVQGDAEGVGAAVEAFFLNAPDMVGNVAGSMLPVAGPMRAVMKRGIRSGLRAQEKVLADAALDIRMIHKYHGPEAAAQRLIAAVKESKVAYKTEIDKALKVAAGTGALLEAGMAGTAQLSQAETQLNEALANPVTRATIYRSDLYQQLLAEAKGDRALADKMFRERVASVAGGTATGGTLLGTVLSGGVAEKALARALTTRTHEGVRALAYVPLVEGGEEGLQYLKGEYAPQVHVADAIGAPPPDFLGGLTTNVLAGAMGGAMVSAPGLAVSQVQKSWDARRTQGGPIPRGNADATREADESAGLDMVFGQDEQDPGMPSADFTLDPNEQGLGMPAADFTLDPNEQGLGMPAADFTLDPNEQGLGMPAADFTLDPNEQQIAEQVQSLQATGLQITPERVQEWFDVPPETAARIAQWVEGDTTNETAAADQTRPDDRQSATAVPEAPVVETAATAVADPAPAPEVGAGTEVPVSARVPGATTVVSVASQESPESPSVTVNVEDDSTTVAKTPVWQLPDAAPASLADVEALLRTIPEDRENLTPAQQSLAAQLDGIQTKLAEVAGNKTKENLLVKRAASAVSTYLTNQGLASPGQVADAIANQQDLLSEEAARDGVSADQVEALVPATHADLTPAVRADLPLVAAIARLFKHPLVLVKSGNQNPLSFDGLMDAKTGSVILAADATRPVTVITIHELVHHLQNNMPQVYGRLRAAVRVAVKSDDAVGRHLRSRGYSPDRVDEYVADVVSDLIHDRPEMLLQIASTMDRREPGAGRRFLTAMKEFLDRLLAGLRGQGSFGTKETLDLTKVTELRKAVVDALAEYALARRSDLAAKAGGTLKASKRAEAVYDVYGPDGKYLGKQSLTPAQVQDRKDAGQEVIYRGTEQRIQASKKQPPSSDVGHKRRSTDRSYVGAPDWVTGEASLGALRRKLRTLAQEGVSGRYWYEKSARAVSDLVGGDPMEVEKFVGLLAIFSQGTEVSVNVGFALEAYYQWKAGLPIDTGRFPGAQSRKAEAWLKEGRDWGGIKVNNFYADLMEEIDASKVDPGHATMDMWMALAFDYGATKLDQGPKYNFAKREVARLAQELGWKPHQVQAAVWTAIKARIEASASVRNAQELKRGIAEKNGNAHSIIKGREYDHFRLAHKVGMAFNITPEEIAARGMDFADAMQARMVQMSWEATPSTSVPDGMEWIHAAPTGVKFKYLTAVAKALTKNGKDMIAEAIGLHTPPTIFGYSAWEGAVGAGAQSFLPVPVVGRKEQRAVLPVARDLLNQYAALRGLVLRQDAVVWHHPIYDEAKARSNGVEIVTQRPLTEEEVQTLYRALHDKFGTWELAPGYTANGARVLNYKDGLTNVAFHSGVNDILKALPAGFGGGDIEAKTFRADGEYISNDWKEKPNGEGYLDTLRAGRPDLQERAASLRARVEAVNIRFTKQYGGVRRSRRGEPDAAGAERTGGLAPASISNGQRPSVRGPALHYSAQQRETLNSAYYGKGLRGAEYDRVMAAEDKRLRQRIYFYMNTGRGAQPEAGVGGHAHTVDLDNLYDQKADPIDLWVGRTPTAFESAVLDSGYDGYLDRDTGIAVLLGPRTVSVRHLGLGARPDLARATESERSAYGKQVAAVMNNRALPAGEMVGSDWKRLMGRLMPEVDVSHLDDGKRYYRSDIVRRSKRATILVDGEERPTTNSNGQRIAQTEEGLRNFWRWFGDSKIVDDQGRPLVVYHSSLADLAQFNTSGKFMGYTGTSGISVTDNPEMASRYLERYADFGWVDGKPNQPFNKNVMALYVKAEKPLYRDEPFRTSLRLGAPLPDDYVSPVVQMGHDALIRNDAISRTGTVKHSDAKKAMRGREIVVFDPTQIKSAIGNDGSFSSTNPDIRRSKRRDMTILERQTRALPTLLSDSEQTAADQLFQAVHNDMLAAIKANGGIPADLQYAPMTAMPAVLQMLGAPNQMVAIHKNILDKVHLWKHGKDMGQVSAADFNRMLRDPAMVFKHANGDFELWTDVWGENGPIMIALVPNRQEMGETVRFAAVKSAYSRPVSDLEDRLKEALKPAVWSRENRGKSPERKLVYAAIEKAPGVYRADRPATTSSADALPSAAGTNGNRSRGWLDWVEGGLKDRSVKQWLDLIKYIGDRYRGPRTDHPARSNREQLADKQANRVTDDPETRDTVAEALDADHEAWVAGKGGVQSHASTMSKGEALAKLMGWSIEDVERVLAQGTVDLGNGRTATPEEVLAGAHSVIRIALAELMQNPMAPDFAHRFHGLINAMTAARVNLSHIGRALAFAGWLQRRPNDPALREKAKHAADGVIAAGEETLGESDNMTDGEREAVREYNKLLARRADTQMDAEEAREDVVALEGELAEARERLKAAQEQRDAARKERTALRQEIKKAEEKTASAIDKMPDPAELAAARQALARAEARAKMATAALWAARKELTKLKARRRALIDRAIKAGEKLQQVDAQIQEMKKPVFTGKGGVSMDEIISYLGGERGLRRIQNTLARFPMDSGKVALFLQGVANNIHEHKKQLGKRPGAWGRFHRITSMMLEQFRAFILMGYHTHMVNIASNGAFQGVEMGLTRALAEAFPGGQGAGAHYRALARALVGLWGDAAPAFWFGLTSESPSRQFEALARARPELQDALLALSGNKWMDQKGGALPGGYGRGVRTLGFSPLGAEDMVFKLVPYWYSVRMQEAAGKTVDQGKAVAAAEYMTFQEEMGAIGQLATRAVQEVPPLGFVMPFVKTLVNLIKVALDYTPVLGQVKNIDNLRGVHGGEARNLALARTLVGASIAALVFFLHGDGDDDPESLLSGAAPLEPNARRLWLASNEPLALKVGDSLLPLWRMEPFASVMAMTMGAIDAARLGSRTDDWAEAGKKIGSVVANTIIGKSFMVGAAELQAAASDPYKDGWKYLNERLLPSIVFGSLIPNTLPQIGDTFDEWKREAKGWQDQFKRRIPGLREDLPPQLDWAGRPVPEPRYHMPLPVQPVKDKTDTVAQWLLKIDKSIDTKPNSIKELPLGTRRMLLLRRRELLQEARWAALGLPKDEQVALAEEAIRAWGREVSEAKASGL